METWEVNFIRWGLIDMYIKTIKIINLHNISVLIKKNKQRYIKNIQAKPIVLKNKHIQTNAHNETNTQTNTHNETSTQTSYKNKQTNLPNERKTKIQKKI